MKLIHCAFGAMLAFGGTLHAQNIVYDMPSIGVVFQVTEGTEYADSATLGGVDRFVTEAFLSVISNVARTGDVTFSIYEPVPVGVVQPGQDGTTPGALAAFQPADAALASVTLTNVSFTAGAGNPTELIFSGIDTLVGDDLFWAIEFENVSNLSGQDQFGPLLGNANGLTVPGSETDPSRLYSRSEDVFGNAWVVTTLSGQAPPTSSLAVTITAVPEPSTVLLSFFGALGLLRRRRVA